MMMVKKLNNNVVPVVAYGVEENITHRSTKKEVSFSEMNGDPSEQAEKE